MIEEASLLIAYGSREVSPKSQADRLIGRQGLFIFQYRFIREMNALIALSHCSQDFDSAKTRPARSYARAAERLEQRDNYLPRALTSTGR